MTLARDAVDVVDLAHHRQALLEVAFHDLGDGGVNVAEPTLGATGKESADDEDEDRRRRQSESERPRHGLAEVVDLGKALAEDEDRAVGAANGDEDRLIGTPGAARGD